MSVVCPLTNRAHSFGDIALGKPPCGVEEGSASEGFCCVLRTILKLSVTLFSDVLSFRRGAFRRITLGVFTKLGFWLVFFTLAQHIESL